MKRYISCTCAVVLSLLIILSTTSVTAQSNSLRAKIGIQMRSSSKVERAKTRDRVRVGDKLRLYIIPETTAYTYVIHTDREIVRLLHRVEYIPADTGHQPIQFPPKRQPEYTIDGQKRLEEFIIICSPIELVYIDNLLGSSQASYQRWKLIEDKLMERSHLNLSGKPEKPFAIAGNVRNMDEPFLQQLRIFSGREFLVKKYEFRVKK